MVNHYNRRVLRICDLPAGHSKIVEDRLSKAGVQLEKVQAGVHSVCAYFRHDCLKRVGDVMLTTLNQLSQGNKKYTVKDFQLLSTTVVVTNIPKQMEEAELQAMLMGYGKLSTKVTFAKIQLPLRYSWVVFDDIRCAENCVKGLGMNKSEDWDVSVAIAPSYITQESQLMETLCSLVVENLSPEESTVAAVQELVASAVPHWGASVVREIFLSAQGGTGAQRAIVDLEHREAAISLFYRLDGMKANPDVYGGPEYCCYFALPHFTAKKCIAREKQ